MNIVPIRNKLAYPAGATPGFDPLHPASRNITATRGLCAVASNNSFVDLVTGKYATDSSTSGGAATKTIHGAVGPAISFGAQTTRSSMAKPTDIISNAVTLAAIFTVPSFAAQSGGFSVLMETDRTNPWSFGTISGGGTDGQVFLYSFQGGGQVNSGIFLQDGVPYFLAASSDPSITLFAATNLRTGAIKTATGLGRVGGNNTTQAAYNIGNGDANANQGSVAKIGAVGYTPQYALPMNELLRWAADPWAFWYPNALPLPEPQLFTPRIPNSNRIAPNARQTVVSDPSGAKVVSS